MKRSELIAIIAIVLTVIFLAIAHLIWPTIASAAIVGVVALASVIIATVAVLLFWRKK